MDFTYAYYLALFKRGYAYLVTLCAIGFAYAAFVGKKTDVCAQTVFVNDGEVQFVNCDVFSDVQKPVLKELAKQIMISIWQYNKGDTVAYALAYQNSLRFIKEHSQAGEWFSNEYTKINGTDGKGPLARETSIVSLLPDFHIKSKDQNRWLISFVVKRTSSQVQGNIDEFSRIRMIVEKGNEHAIYQIVGITRHDYDG